MPTRPSKASRILWSAIPLLSLAAASGAASALTVVPASWEVASEFSDTTPPTGFWRYGMKATVNGIFVAMTNPVNAWSGNIKGWDGPATVLHNVNQTPYVVPNPGGPVKVPAHGLTLHPGPACQYAVVRFSVPQAGTYRIAGQFFGLDPNGVGTTTDVHILRNNGSLFAAVIAVGGSTPNANFLINAIALGGNDKIEFEVGCGANNTYNYDTTGLNAVITRL